MATKIKTFSFFAFLFAFGISQKVFAQNNILGKWIDKEHKQKKRRQSVTIRRGHTQT